jgi:hypothetical protein
MKIGKYDFFCGMENKWKGDYKIWTILPSFIFIKDIQGIKYEIEPYIGYEVWFEWMFISFYFQWNINLLSN